MMSDVLKDLTARGTFNCVVQPSNEQASCYSYDIPQMTKKMIYCCFFLLTILI